MILMTLSDSRLELLQSDLTSFVEGQEGPFRSGPEDPKLLHSAHTHTAYCTRLPSAVALLSLRSDPALDVCSRGFRRRGQRQSSRDTIACPCPCACTTRPRTQYCSKLGTWTQRPCICSCCTVFVHCGHVLHGSTAEARCLSDPSVCSSRGVATATTPMVAATAASRSH